MNAELAEFIGIFIGDGSLNIRKHKHSYEFKFTGNPRNEVAYYNHVSKLATLAVGRNIETKVLDGGRSVGLYFCSKEFAGYLMSVGINAGPKTERITMPALILQHDVWARACIRGIFDTDGCFTLKKKQTYPVITFAMKCRGLLLQISQVLKRLNIGHCICFEQPYFDPRTNRVYTKHYLSINGRKNVRRWFELVGTNNPKIAEKYQGYKSLL